MKKFWVSLAAALLACLTMCSCASNTKIASISIQPEERTLQDARQQYRSASLVVRGECLLSHIDSEGRECYDVEVTNILAGDAELGEIVHCTSMELIAGEEYLLYLGDGEDAFHTEDTSGYIPVHEEPLRIVDNEVIWGNTRISLSKITRDIAQQKLIISAPAKSYYYKTLGELVKASDQIFIGKVKSVPKWSPMTLRSTEDGASVEKSAMTSLTTIEAYGSIKGKFKYGDEITMVNSSEKLADLLDAVTLRPKDYEHYEVPTLREGGFYLFFLTEGPDAKQDYYFPVNQIQGYAELDGETLSASYSNEALKSNTILTPLVKQIQTLIAAESEQSSPELRID